MTIRSKRLPSPSSPHGDSGSGTLELVIVFPVVLLLIFTIIQAALFFHARNVALASAQQGVRAATGYEGAASQGATTTREFLSTAGLGALKNIRVTQGRSNRQVTITVAGTAPSIVPGINLSVIQTATGPQERFTN